MVMGANMKSWILTSTTEAFGVIPPPPVLGTIPPPGAVGEPLHDTMRAMRTPALSALSDRMVNLPAWWGRQPDGRLPGSRTTAGGTQPHARGVRRLAPRTHDCEPRRR